MLLRLVLVMVALLATGCAAHAPFVWARDLPPEAASQRVLAPLDKVQVVVQGQDQLSGEFEVRPGGDFLVPAIGRVVAAGKTPDALAAELTTRLTGVLAAPHVSVLFISRPLPYVSVLGEVKTPGRYELHEGEGLLDVLARAGGITAFASSDGIYLLRKNKPGPRIRFRYDELTATANRRFELGNGDVVVVE
jgi:polysaccharide export outer membrane protein